MYYFLIYLLLVIDTVVYQPLIPRDNLSNDVFDIGIVVLLKERNDDENYLKAINTLRCYATVHKYGFDIHHINDKYWKEKCSQSDFMFQRHCVMAHLMNQHNWTLFVDADMAIVNPHVLLEKFILNTTSDIIFYDRFFNFEIAAGSYFVKNTTDAKKLLMKFAELDSIKYFGSDNAAIHWLILKEFFNATETHVCYKLWAKARDWSDLEEYTACCRHVIGEQKEFTKPNGKGFVKILPKATGWVRDGWLTNSLISLDVDFMVHGWKESGFRALRVIEDDPESAPNHYWNSPISNLDEIQNCLSGVTWKWYSNFLQDSTEIHAVLNTREELTKIRYDKILNKLNITQL